MDEEQLRLGVDWEITLEKMIEKSDMMLFFITPYSARRPDGYCLNELGRYIIDNKPIIPIMLKYFIPPLSICRLQYLDLENLAQDKYQEKINDIIEILNDYEKLGFDGEHLNNLNSLNPLKFETNIAKHIHNFKGREWVRDEVDNWLEKEDNSKVLWLKAEAGFGKSAIATYLTTKHPLALGIHFCQFDYRESQDAREMLKALIFQLSTQIPEYAQRLQNIDIKREITQSPEHIFTQLLVEPLLQIDKPKEKHFFIIDALDESYNDDKSDIVELISNRFMDLPKWLNIVITSRNEHKLTQKLKKFNPLELKTNDDRNKEDLKLYLEDKISNKELIDPLIKKSEGNILYLKSIFELDILKESELNLEAIEELPNNIEAFYLTYFERKFLNSEEYEEKYLDFVSLLVHQKGSPEILMKDMLDINKREYQKIKSQFGSLLKVEDNILTFYHQTIYEWLESYDKSGDYSTDKDRGEKLYDDFLSSLTAESYKEEYLNLELFNNKIIQSIYKKNKNTEVFFKLLEPHRGKNLIKTFNNLDLSFIETNLEKFEYYTSLMEVIITLYEESNLDYKYTYLASMNNVACSLCDFDNNTILVFEDNSEKPLEVKSYNFACKYFENAIKSIGDFDENSVDDFPLAYAHFVLNENLNSFTNSNKIFMEDNLSYTIKQNIWMSLIAPSFDEIYKNFKKKKN